MKAALLFLAGLACSLILQAQFLPATTYSTKDGLVADRLTCLTQTDNGILYFGSYYGISSYDGVKFQTLSLPASQQNKYVNCVAGSGNTLYAGFLFNGGLLRHQNGTSVAYHLPERAVDANDLVALATSSPDTAIVANIRNELYTFAAGRFAPLATLPLPARGGISALCKKGNLVLAATVHGLFAIDVRTGRWRTIQPATNFFSVTLMGNREIWAAGYTQGRTCITQLSADDTAIHHTRTLQPDFAPRPIPFCSGSGKNEWWFVDDRRGLGKMTAAGTLSFFENTISLNTNTAALFADREGNIWSATEPGVVKVPNSGARHYRFAEIAAGGGTLLVGSDSVLWATNARALYRLSGDTWQQVPDIRGSYRTYFNALATNPDGSLWIGTWDGGVWQTRWDRNHLQVQQFIKSSEHGAVHASAIRSIGAGELFLAGNNGLFHLRRNKIIDHFTPSLPGISTDIIVALEADTAQHLIWLGLNQGGVLQVHYQPEKDGRFRYTVQQRIAGEQGLDDLAVRSLCLSADGTLWIGTRINGVYALRQKNGRTLVEKPLLPGLQKARVGVIIRDGNGTCIGSSEGVFLQEQAGGKLRQFTAGNGLLNTEIFSLAFSAGKLWALSAGGVTALELHAAETPRPLVGLRSVTINGQPDTTQPAGERILRDAGNTLSFQFYCTSFLDERKVRYRYRLEEYQNEWSEPSPSGNITYASLPPGHFVLRVMAENAVGQWSPPTTVYRFHIVRPVYKKGWFWALAAFALLAVVYWLRLQQVKRKLELEKMRFSIARDLHDDIGSALGSINILSQSATRKLSGSPAADAASVFEKIGNTAQVTLEAMDDIVWAINPGKDRLEDLVVRMREFAIPLFEAQDIRCRTSVTVPAEQVIGLALRRNLFLVFKEAVHNCLKYSGATEVQVSLEARQQQLRLVVADNGQGFDPAQQTARNGLRNMHVRAAKLGGQLEIRSGAGGTTVALTCPIK